MSYDPLFYALVHQGNEGDLEMYLRLCAGASRVLEFGCGYGRVSLALAEAGSEVWGIDLHEGLLSLAHERVRALEPSVRSRVHLSLGDMRTVQSEGRFDRVIIPFSGLYCLENDEEVIACLRRARALLEDDGLLIFDGYAADSFHHECEPDDQAEDHLDHVALIAVSGVAYDVYEKSSWNRDTQRVVATYLHVPDGAGFDAAEAHAIAQRYLLAEQLAPLFAASGFRLRHLWGSFDGEPYDHESDVMVVVAEPI